ncbi:MAG: hypothetical protein K0S38_474 [Candidatus Paceibacter sp.]|jgi:hypothetical protein|nr:hypothetical protein [Candidatus Paceibacter sp.]
MEELDIHMGMSGVYIHAIVQISGGSLNKDLRFFGIRYRKDASQGFIQKRIQRVLITLVLKKLLILDKDDRIDVTAQPIATTGKPRRPKLNRLFPRRTK